MFSKIQKLALVTTSAALLALIAMIGSGAFAQTIHSDVIGTLSYIKFAEDQSIEYRQLVDGEISSIVVSNDRCSSMSPSGAYVAILNSQDGHLEVVRLSDEQVILTQPIEGDEQECGFGWNATDEIILSISNAAAEVIDVETGDVETILRNEAFDIDLPNRIQQSPTLHSPDSSIVIYNQCNSTITQEASCPGNDQIVLFDVRSREVLEVFNDADPFILGESENQQGFGPPNPPAIFWSPSSRYILYQPTEAVGLRIYDVLQDQYHNIELGQNAIFAPSAAGVHWSHDEERVGFWTLDGIESGIGEPQRFVAFDLASDIVLTLNQPYILRNSFNWVWSPDTQSIALVNSNSDLIIAMISGSGDFVIDTDVSSIVAWTQ